MDDVVLHPMTQADFDALRSGLIQGYADAHVQAGDWRADGAERLAAGEVDRLLPQGPDTPGMLVLTGTTRAGTVIGHVWVALEHWPGSGTAWIYDIEVAEDRRGHGHGRALLQAAEREACRHGVKTIGLNVFGANAVARRLYESAGYEVTSQQMAKRLV